jgi:hypothetical protein
VMVPTDALPLIARQLAQPANADTDLSNWMIDAAEDSSGLLN